MLGKMGGRMVLLLVNPLANCTRRSELSMNRPTFSSGGFTHRIGKISECCRLRKELALRLLHH